MHKRSPYDVMLSDYLSGTHNIKNPRKLFKCLNPEHSDEHPSMSITKDGKYIHCFACGKTYTLTELVMQDQNCGYFEAINYLKSQYKNINLDKITQLQIEKEKKKFGFDKITKILEEDKKNKVVDSKAVEYLKSRGFLNPEVIAEMATLKVINDRLYIPHFHLAKRGENYDKEFICTDYISRNLNPDAKIRYIRQKDVKTTYFALQDFNAIQSYMRLGFFKGLNPVIFINEGEIDALSYYDLLFTYGKSFENDFNFKEAVKNNPKINYLNYPSFKDRIFFNSMATSSTGNVDNFIKSIDSLDTKIKEKLYFVVSCDNDNAGKDANKKIIDYFEKNNIMYKLNPFAKEGYKDINERLEKDRESLQQEFNHFIEKSNSYVNYAYGKRTFKRNKASIYKLKDGRRYIPFVNCFCFEGRLHSDYTVSIYGTNYGEDKPYYIEKREVANSKFKIDEQIKNLKENMESVYYRSMKLHDENNQIFVKVRTGYYVIPENESNNAYEILGSISRDEIHVNKAVYLVDGYGKFDNYKKKGISLLEAYNSNNELIYKEEWKNGAKLSDGLNRKEEADNSNNNKSREL